jgi:hypothetical protein
MTPRKGYPNDFNKKNSMVIVVQTRQGPDSGFHNMSPMSNCVYRFYICTFFQESVDHLPYIVSM